MVGYASSEGVGRSFWSYFFVILFILTFVLKFSLKKRGCENKGVDFEMGIGTRLHAVGRQRASWKAVLLFKCFFFWWQNSFWKQSWPVLSCLDCVIYFLPSYVLGSRKIYALRLILICLVLVVVLSSGKWIAWVKLECRWDFWGLPSERIHLAILFFVT